MVAPHQAFQEISRRARPELIATTLVILLLQPIVQANPAVSYVHNVLFLSVFFLFYALGRTCLLLMACRWFSCRLSLRTAFQAVLINEVIGVFLMGALVAIPSLQGISGQVPYMKLGLGSWLVSLGETHPILFNYLAQVHVFTLWGFGMWWIGIATLTKIEFPKGFVVALLSFVAMYSYVCPLRHLVQALVVW